MTIWTLTLAMLQQVNLQLCSVHKYPKAIVRSEQEQMTNSVYANITSGTTLISWANEIRDHSLPCKDSRHTIYERNYNSITFIIAANLITNTPLYLPSCREAQVPRGSLYVVLMCLCRVRMRQDLTRP